VPGEPAVAPQTKEKQRAYDNIEHIRRSIRCLRPAGGRDRGAFLRRSSNRRPSTRRLDEFRNGAERIASADSITEFVPGFLISSLGIVPVTVTDPGAHGSTGATSTRVQAIINGVRH